VHAVVIMNSSATCAVGVISDLDVVSAVAAGADCSAREAAATEPLTVMADESLPSAAQRMSEHGVSHLVVLDSAVGHPVGILSTLDIAAAYANA
jgi:CBS domain-containing protein